MRHRLTPMVLLLAVALVIPVALGPGVAAAGKKAPVFMGDADGNRLSDDLDTRLASATGGEAVPVIVSLTAPPDDATLAQLAVATGNFQPTARWSHALNAVAARLDRGQIEALTRCQLVNRVDLDREYSACLNKATLWTGVQRIWADWGLDGDRDGNPASYSTTDVVISVIDTGIDATHVDLDGGKVLVFYDAVMEGPVPSSVDGPAGTLGEVTMPYDDHGHGTHVSSIAAGTGEGNPAYRGVAPGAALVGVKVLDSGGFGTSTQIIEGIDWMIANRAAYNIRIGNMSLGSSASSDGTDPVSVAVSNAVANGIIMCVAGGNSGPNTYTTGSPAAATEAITVGALYDPGEKGWALAEFSSRGPTADGRTKPDICAPGRYITAAAKGTDTGYIVMSGTSMATPFVAGVVGLMLDADYALTDAGVKSILYAPGSLKDFGPAGKDIDFGWGVCLPYEDVKQAGGFSETWTDGLDFSYTTGSVRKGKSVYYDIAVTNDSRPIAITFIIQNYTTAFNFDIYLYDPAGALVASSQTLKRQEQITYQPILPASSAGDGPQATSTYRLKVTSKAGSGDFWFNVSWK